MAAEKGRLNMNEQSMITVAVLTYRPDNEKLLATLRSVLLQQAVDVEIVIADDGSAQKDFGPIRAFFRDAGFTRYRIVENPENRGTVYNTLSAVENSRGKYIKLISPGDLLANEQTLSRWVAAMEESGAQLSFSDAIYYAPTAEGPVCVINNAYPSQPGPYEKENREACRYGYLICEDLFLGAATLCLGQTLHRYLEQIAGKVVYAEDNVYRLMAYDRVPVCYFRESAVLYETGLGVSTSGSDIWKQRLAADWNATSALLMARCTGADAIDKKLRLLLTAPKQTTIHKCLLYLQLPGLVAYKLKNKLCRRKTPDALPVEFLQKVFPRQ